MREYTGPTMPPSATNRDQTRFCLPHQPLSPLILQQPARPPHAYARPAMPSTAASSSRRLAAAARAACACALGLHWGWKPLPPLCLCLRH